MKLLSKKYESQISINYYSFDLNLHKDYKKKKKKSSLRSSSLSFLLSINYD